MLLVEDLEAISILISGGAANRPQPVLLDLIHTACQSVPVTIAGQNDEGIKPVIMGTLENHYNTHRVYMVSSLVRVLVLSPFDLVHSDAQRPEGRKTAILKGYQEKRGDWGGV